MLCLCAPAHCTHTSCNTCHTYTYSATHKKQVPQFILEQAVLSGQGASCHVIVTQPRRIAAMSVAERVAVERGEKGMHRCVVAARELHGGLAWLQQFKWHPQCCLPALLQPTPPSHHLLTTATLSSTATTATNCQ